jgi:hypothetical protein
MELEDQVRILIEEKYTELAGAAVAELKRTAPPCANPGGEEYANAWEEFSAYAQEEPEEFYPEYEELLESVGKELVERLTLTELRLLWCGSGGLLEWEGGEEGLDFPSIEQMRNDVLEETLSWVEEAAMDEDAYEEEYLDEDEMEESDDIDAVDDLDDGEETPQPGGYRH